MDKEVPPDEHPDEITEDSIQIPLTNEQKNMETHNEKETSNTFNSNDTRTIISGDKKSVKWWVWAILVCALLAVSSAASALRKLENVPPLMKASWRLQCTSLILFVGFVYHFYMLMRSVDGHANEEFSPVVRK